MNRRALFARLPAVAAVVSFLRAAPAQAHVEHISRHVTLQRGTPIPGPHPESLPAISGDPLKDYLAGRAHVSTLGGMVRHRWESGPLKWVPVNNMDDYLAGSTQLNDYAPWVTIPSMLEPKEQPCFDRARVTRRIARGSGRAAPAWPSTAWGAPDASGSRERGAWR